MNEPDKSSQIGSRRAWFILCLTALTFGYAFFHRVAPSVMVSDLMAEFAIGAALLGTLSSLYFYPYVLLQVPLGALIDHLGPRILLSTAIAIGGVGSFLFGTAETLTIAYAGRVMIGIGSAVGFLGTLAIAGKWFRPEQFGFLAGLVMFFGMMSGVFASGPLAYFVEIRGWREAMTALGIFSFVLAAAIFLFVRNAPEELASETDARKSGWGNMWRGLGEALTSSEVWKVALVASTMSGPMLALGTLWATPYLVAAYQLDRPAAAFLVSLMLMGWAFGAPFFGWLSDRIRRRKAILVVTSGVLTVLVALLVFLPTPPLWLTVGLFLSIGISGACMAISFALIRETSPKEISGSVTGIVNSMTVASGAVLQPVVGLLLDRLWNGTLDNGARVYLESDYRQAFTVILAATAVGFLISLSLKESPIATSAKNGSNPD